MLQVGSKVSAVSRKTNTTHKEHMGILTKGDSQLVLFLLHLFSFSILRRRSHNEMSCLSCCAQMKAVPK